MVVGSANSGKSTIINTLKGAIERKNLREAMAKAGVAS